MSDSAPEVGEIWVREWDGKRVEVTDVRRGSQSWAGGRVRFKIHGASNYQPDYTLAEFLEFHQLKAGADRILTQRAQRGDGERAEQGEGEREEIGKDELELNEEEREALLEAARG